MGYVEGLLARNETIVIHTRQHWRRLAGSALANGFLFIVLLALGIAFRVVPVLQGVILDIVVVMLFIFAIFPILAFVREFLEWWNEEYLVTSRRVIQARGILGKHVIDSSLDKVNDVVLTQSFLGRLFNYGDIEILTASEVGVNLLHMIAEPLKFKLAMMNQREAMSRGSEHPHDHASPDAAELLHDVDELHQQGVLTDQEYGEKKKQLLDRMKIN